jgi:hypothetical protein
MIRNSPIDTSQRITGYAVMTADGYFVGIWKSREIAEKMCNRPPATGERVVVMEEA